MPVVAALSQSTLPHAQAAVLAEDPSVIAQDDGRLHASKHTKPVPVPC